MLPLESKGGTPNDQGQGPSDRALFEAYPQGRLRLTAEVLSTRGRMAGDLCVVEPDRPDLLLARATSRNPADVRDEVLFVDAALGVRRCGWRSESASAPAAIARMHTEHTCTADSL